MTGNGAIAIYARVSTTAQEEGLQVAALREYAARRGLVPIEYIDRGYSGAMDSRPELSRLMEDARRRRFQVVAVWKFDRAARSVEHLTRMLREFESLGIGFASVTEAFDLATPAGKLVFHVLAAVAEMERSVIAERVRAGMAHAKAHGKAVGRPRLVVDDEELLRLHEAGLSVREIATGMSADDGKTLRHPSPSLVSRELRRLLEAGASGNSPVRARRKAQAAAVPPGTGGNPSALCAPGGAAERFVNGVPACTGGSGEDGAGR